MARFLAGLVLSLTPVFVGAAAQTAAPETACYSCLTYYRNSAGRTNLIEDVGLDRDEPERTILLKTADYNQLHLVIFYTYSTATEVLVKLSCSTDTVAFKPRSADTLDSEGRNQRYLLSYDVSGCKTTRVVFAGSTDANSADVITVQAVGQSTADPQQQLPVQ